MLLLLPFRINCLVVCSRQVCCQLSVYIVPHRNLVVDSVVHFFLSFGNNYSSMLVTKLYSYNVVCVWGKWIRDVIVWCPVDFHVWNDMTEAVYRKYMHHVSRNFASLACCCGCFLLGCIHGHIIMLWWTAMHVSCCARWAWMSLFSVYYSIFLSETCSGSSKWWDLLL